LLYLEVRVVRIVRCHYSSLHSFLAFAKNISIVDVDAVLGSLCHMDVGDVADILEVHDPSIFREPSAPCQVLCHM
jgi:hypothetical protein